MLERSLRTRFPRILSVAGLFVALNASTTNPGPLPDERAITETVVLMAKSTGVDCHYYCNPCEVWPIYEGREMKYTDHFDVYFDDYGWDDCIIDGLCPAPNNECLPGEPSISPDALRDLWGAFANNSVEELARLMSVERIEFNVKRRAIQAMGCGKTVVAHIPLTGSQFKHLSDLASGN
jgi:hypothetical protein